MKFGSLTGVAVIFKTKPVGHLGERAAPSWEKKPAAAAKSLGGVSTKRLFPPIVLGEKENKSAAPSFSFTQRSRHFLFLKSKSLNFFRRGVGDIGVDEALSGSLPAVSAPESKEIKKLHSHK